MDRRPSFFVFCWFMLFAVEAQVCFNPIVNYQAGTSAISVTSADFNKDGLADLAVANTLSNKFTLLLNQGAGAFTPSANFNVGDAPFWITSGDFNEDSNPDVVLAHEGSNDVGVLFGNGAGGFAPPVFYPTASEASSVRAVDLNHDNHLDLVVTQFHYDSLVIFLGDGAGNFTVKGYYFVGLTSEAEQSDYGDLNEDGHLDLVVGCWGGYLAVRFGDGTGAMPTGYTFSTNGLKTTEAVIHDLDGDGHLDVAASNYFSHDVSVLIGDGLGNFASSVEYAVGGLNPFCVWKGDFDGDGKMDLCTANEGSGTVSVIIGDGLGGFGPPAVFPASTWTEQTITADFNNDGRIDIAAANMDTNRVTVLLNVPPPTVTANATTDTLCAGDPLTLYGGGATTYTWSGGVSNGVAFTATASATYTVTGTDAGGCTNTDTIGITVNICTHIAEASFGVSVYPNPARVGEEIKLIMNTPAEVSLYTGSGVMMWRGLLRDNRLPALSMAAGTYIVQVRTPDGVVTRKLVILD